MAAMYSGPFADDSAVSLDHLQASTQSPTRLLSRRGKSANGTATTVTRLGPADAPSPSASPAPTMDSDTLQSLFREDSSGTLNGILDKGKGKSTDQDSGISIRDVSASPSLYHVATADSARDQTVSPQSQHPPPGLSREPSELPAETPPTDPETPLDVSSPTEGEAAPADETVEVDWTQYEPPEALSKIPNVDADTALLSQVYRNAITNIKEQITQEAERQRRLAVEAEERRVEEEKAARIAADKASRVELVGDGPVFDEFFSEKVVVSAPDLPPVEVPKVVVNSGGNGGGAWPAAEDKTFPPLPPKPQKRSRLARLFRGGSEDLSAGSGVARAESSADGAARNARSTLQSYFSRQGLGLGSRTTPGEQV
jgi:hypothetical protein